MYWLILDFSLLNFSRRIPGPSRQWSKSTNLHSYWSYRNEIILALPLSIFLDNLKVYDFVLHAEDVQRIYKEGTYMFFVQTATSNKTVWVRSNIKELSRIVFRNSAYVFGNPGKESV